MTGAPWFVVRVRPQYKYINCADENVRNQGAEFYCPHARIQLNTPGLYKKTPLFPGYAFVRHPEGRWGFLTGTRGISGILMGTEEEPALLPDHEVAKIREREGPDGLVWFAHRQYSSGEQVSVEVGDTEFSAMVESMSGEDRVWVLMRILGQWSRAEVSVSRIQRVEVQEGARVTT